MQQEIDNLQQQALAAIQQASSVAALDEVDVEYLGRKRGQLTLLLKNLGTMSDADRRAHGGSLNAAKQVVTTALAERRHQLQGAAAATSFDITAPGQLPVHGHFHLVTQAIRDIENIFTRLGFARRRYPEVEWDYYAFESLNMPPDHPARDEWETFFIDNEPIGPHGQRVLTPHTSSGQIREMEQRQLPIRMTNISKCYRRQIDVSHVPMFHQFEGLYIDQGIHLGHLKGVLDYFVKNFFGPQRRIRLRPFHFQFTEPSFEIDISCGVCNGDGCRLCKEGWLELGGAGMVHPNVLKAGKIDATKYSGFAFGWGVERTYMMKEGLRIDDIRVLYKNDLRFLSQF